MNIKISWKNVWRNKLRSFIIILAIAVGLFGGIFTNAFFVGMLDQRINAVIGNETANLQLHHPSFLLDESINNGMPDIISIFKKIKTVDGVKGISFRINETGMASTAESNTGVMINGIDPELEKEVTKIHEKLYEGEYLNTSSQIPILIGKKLSEKLNTDLGDKIILSMADGDGEVVYAAFKVRGIYNTNNDMFDGVHVFVLKDKLQQLLKTPPNYATEIAISMEDDQLTLKAKEDIKALFQADVDQKEIIVQDWREIDPSLNLMIQSMDTFAWFFIIIILIALAFGIVNTMIMVVMERTRELGMLMAIGMNKRRVFSMILWETVFLSSVGAVIGLVFSAIVIGYLGKVGLDLSLFGKGMNALGFDTIIYLKSSIEFYITVASLVFITAIIASIFPARQALKLQPAEAVRD